MPAAPHQRVRGCPTPGDDSSWRGQALTRLRAAPRPGVPGAQRRAPSALRAGLSLQAVATRDFVCVSVTKPSGKQLDEALDTSSEVHSPFSFSL